MTRGFFCRALAHALTFVSLLACSDSVDVGQGRKRLEQ